MLGLHRKAEKIEELIRNSGFLFLLISAILFYNTLLVASNNPGYFVPVYFNYYNEFHLEYALFLCFIPLIIYFSYIEFVRMFNVKNIFKEQDIKRK